MIDSVGGITSCMITGSCNLTDQASTVSRRLQRYPLISLNCHSWWCLKIATLKHQDQASVKTGDDVVQYGMHAGHAAALYSKGLLDNSRIRQLVDCQITDWRICGCRH